ncbi:MAG: ATP-binding cassette domain-containing protein [Candidatus Cloacimonetes bacterium]|nr:ATP-binding cassette domain-containing protein [Candidatus Cloacimonadota bacterium]
MIRLENLVKNYGQVHAVDNISFDVPEGQILGFLGPNGAGKSTTLKVLTCFLSPTNGNIIVDDKYNIYEHSREIRQMIGYLPENNPLYTDMTVYDFLAFIADMRSIPKQEFKQTLRRVISKTGIEEVISKRIDTLSKGYKQRVGLAQAIIHDPRILILDEPTTGLDPNQIIEIRELIQELGKDKTLIISSHILQEVQAVCDRIIIINKGKIVADGATEELKAAHRNKTHLVLISDIPQAEIATLTQAIPALTLIETSSEADNTKYEIEFDTNQDFRKDIYNWFKQTNWVLLEMYRESVSLEDVFRNLTIDDGGTTS